MIWNKSGNTFYFLAWSLVLSAAFAKALVVFLPDNLFLQQYIAALPISVLICGLGIVYGIPRVFLSIVFFSALASALIGFSFSYQIVSSSASARVFVARFPGDMLETESRKLADLIDRFAAIEGSSLFVHRYPEVVHNAQEANLLLAKHRELQAVIWGDPRWLRVALRFDPQQAVSSLRVGSWSPKMVTQIPEFGLSWNPLPESARFLASLLSASSLKDAQEIGEARTEIGLRAAASQRSFWSGLSHASYAYFLLGNLFLEEFIEEGKQSSGDLACALKAYTRGLSLIRLKEYPELRAALANNTGVALLLASQMPEKTASAALFDQERALQYFFQARRYGMKKKGDQSKLFAPQVAFGNEVFLALEMRGAKRAVLKNVQKFRLQRKHAQKQGKRKRKHIE